MDGEYISAVPGSGKTETLINKCYDLMKENDVSSVVAITFTERAASELMERLKKKAINDDRKDLLKELPSSNVGTIHNFCSKIVRKYGTEVGIHWNFRVMDELESESLLDSTIRRFIIGLRNDKKQSPPKIILEEIMEKYDMDLEAIVKECSTILESHKGYFSSMKLSQGCFFTKYSKDIFDAEVMKEIVSRVKISLIPDIMSLLFYIIGEYQEVKIRRKLMDFDDLLLYTLKIVEKYGDEISKRYTFILVDEFQDTDQLQIAIFENLLKHGSSFYVVGDFNQSIYSFRGAHQAAQLKFVENISNHTFLKVNRRSSKNLISFYNKFFPLLIKSESMESFSDDEGRVACYVVDTPEDSLMAVAEIIKEKVRKGEKQGDIAILSRISTDFFNIKSYLRAQGIESILISGESLLKSQEGLDILSLVKYLADPSDAVSQASLLFSPIFGMDVSGLMRISDKQYEFVWKVLGKYRELLKSERLDFVLNKIITREGYIKKLLLLPDGEERVDRIFRIMEIVSSYIGRYGGDPHSVIDWWENSLESKESGPIDDLLKDSSKVKIMTIHQAKGLEFDTVIIYDLDPGRGREKYESEEHCGLVVKTDADFINSPSRKLLEKIETRLFSSSEEIRVLYVAFTRAKRELHIVLNNKELKEQKHLEKSDNLVAVFQKVVGLTKNMPESARNEKIMGMGMMALKVKNTPPLERKQFTQSINLAKSQNAASTVDLDEENLRAIIQFLSERNDKVEHLRISEAGSLVTTSKNGLKIYEVVPRQNNYFVNKGKVEFSLEGS